MTDTEYYELAKSFFYHIIQYGYENMEVNLKKEIRNYITRENRAIELKLTTDADFYSNVILRYLKELDYFEVSQKTQNEEMYRLTENGKAYFVRTREPKQIINPRLKFFMPPNIDEEVEEKQWQIFNKQSNPSKPDKFKRRVFAVRQVNVKLELIYKDTVGGNFPDSTIPLCAIIETENTFDLYGIKLTDTNGVIEAKSYLHQIPKSQYVLAEYFE